MLSYNLLVQVYSSNMPGGGGGVCTEEHMQLFPWAKPFPFPLRTIHYLMLLITTRNNMTLHAGCQFQNIFCAGKMETKCLNWFWWNLPFLYWWFLFGISFFLVVVLKIAKRMLPRKEEDFCILKCSVCMRNLIIRLS